MFSGSCPGWVFGAGSEAPGCCPGTSDFGVGAVGPGVTGGWPDVACCFVVDTGVTGSRPSSPGDPESSKISRGGITFDQSIPRFGPFFAMFDIALSGHDVFDSFFQHRP
jgi:hypothetical protein